MLASFLKRDLRNLIQRDASPNFQAQNGLLSLRSWWRSVRSLNSFGTLSLENNGGFASVRSRRSNLGLKPGDTLLIRLRGDGREYLLNLYVPSLQIAYFYRASILTKAGEWIEVRIPLKDCYATSFGQKLSNAGPIDAPKINSIGFMLSDKKAGPFKLEIAWVKVVGGKPKN